jgi:Lar family restriction alleviation protein
VRTPEVTELLPCPFCGTEPRQRRQMDESLYSHATVEYLQIVCDGCNCESVASERHDEVIAAWNQRSARSAEPVKPPEAADDYRAMLAAAPRAALSEAKPPADETWLLSDEALEIGRKAIEDTLIEWRDERLSEPMRGNGLVIREKDGTKSDVIRFGPETALRIGLKAMLARAALNAAHVLASPSGWMNAEGRVCSAAEKHSMENHQGIPGKRMAATFTTPLYASPPPLASLPGEGGEA